jgi:hypothetical protein
MFQENSGKLTLGLKSVVNTEGVSSPTVCNSVLVKSSLGELRLLMLELN